MLVSIINHNRNADAIALREAFAPLVPVRLLDSGSKLSEAERKQFDECLPNVYYSGLLNRTAEIARSEPPEAPVLLICSDVGVGNAGHLLACLSDAFSDPRVMVWAPCAKVRSFPHMVPHGTGGLRRVSFADGFCFAARRKLFDQVCPVDVTVNRIGWGPDVQFGYLAAIAGGLSVIDDRVEVVHDEGSGYAYEEASRQYLDWRSRLPWPARMFHLYGRRDRYLEGMPSRALIFATALLSRLWRIPPPKPAA
jgi:hypothetical protein